MKSEHWVCGHYFNHSFLIRLHIELRSIGQGYVLQYLHCEISILTKLYISVDSRFVKRYKGRYKRCKLRQALRLIRTKHKAQWTLCDTNWVIQEFPSSKVVKFVNWAEAVAYQLYIRKDKNKEKEARNGPSLKKIVNCFFLRQWFRTKTRGKLYRNLYLHKIISAKVSVVPLSNFSNK